MSATADYVRLPKTAMVVAGRIRSEIVRNQLANGDELMPLEQLATRFGVSLPTLREALRILESEGLISIRRGTRGGVRIHRPDSRSAAMYAGLVLQAESTTILDVYQARCVLEPAAVRALAEAFDAGAIKRLRGAVDEIRTIEDPVTFLRAGTHFHLLIVELTGNRTLTLIASILRQIAEAAVTQVTKSLVQHEAVLDRQGALSRYDRLLELIEAGDADGAEAHWRTQMEMVTRRTVNEVGEHAVIDVLGSQ